MVERANHTIKLPWNNSNQTLTNEYTIQPNLWGEILRRRHGNGTRFCEARCIHTPDGMAHMKLKLYATAVWPQLWRGNCDGTTCLSANHSKVLRINNVTVFSSCLPGRLQRSHGGQMKGKCLGPRASDWAKGFTHTQPEMWEVGVEILQGAIHTKNHSRTKRDNYMASRISTGSKLHTTNLL